MTFAPNSRSLLAPCDLARFPDDTLFHRVARVVCEARCLPRKELYESWGVARRVRRRLSGSRLVDLACGHALTTCMLLLIDDRIEHALAVDARLPASAHKLVAALSTRFPQLSGRITLQEKAVEAIELTPRDLVVSVHACGALTDLVLDHASAVRARVAVLPCCHDKETCDTGGLEAWMDVSLAIDATRVLKLRAAGYDVHTQTIPSAITPKNRLLIASPRDDA